MSNLFGGQDTIASIDNGRVVTAEDSPKLRVAQACFSASALHGDDADNANGGAAPVIEQLIPRQIEISCNLIHNAQHQITLTYRHT
jgi:hypothetical protein